MGETSKITIPCPSYSQSHSRSHQPIPTSLEEAGTHSTSTPEEGGTLSAGPGEHEPHHADVKPVTTSQWGAALQSTVAIGHIQIPKEKGL